MTYKKTLSALLCLSFLCALLLGGCSRNVEPISKTSLLFDTIVTITIYDNDDTALLTECFDLCEKYENMLSRTIEDSDVSKINATGDPVEVSDETVSLIETALKYAKLSDGKFDPTIGALAELWDFKNNTGIVPDDTDIQDALSTVGYEQIQIDGNTVQTPKGTILDLGGIAKGYIADRLKEYLLSQGVTSATINLGGNVLTVGKKTDGTPFQIGIMKPFEDSAVICGLAVDGKSVVTSGNYERYFEADGKLYHHILDTATGYPVENNLYAVTILSDSSVDGDALSTTCYALGLEDATSLIESIDGVEALFITSDYEIIRTSGITDDIFLSVE
jgi:thiamine biosynthesis lipoprotein